MTHSLCCPDIAVFPKEAAMLNLAPVRRRLRVRQITLADGTTVTVQARVPTRRGETSIITPIDELGYLVTTDLALPIIPEDDFDPSI